MRVVVQYQRFGTSKCSASAKQPGTSAEYDLSMRVTTGTVVSGRVVFDESEFVDGTHVVVVSRDPEDDVLLSPHELAELEAGIAEADRGETISGDELFARLRRYG